MSRRCPPPHGPTTTVAAIVALLAGGVAGCGGAQVSARAQPSGRSVFAQHCELCHSVSGTPSPEQQGGDLRSLRLPREQLVQYTVEMPVIRRRLSSAEVRAVVSYLQAVERRR